MKKGHRWDMLRISDGLSENSTNLVSSSADKPSNDISSICDQQKGKSSEQKGK